MGESSASGIEISASTENAPKPLLGMKFNTYEEAYNYYNHYALLMGFGIRKSTVNYSKKTRDVLDRKFVCDKEGYRSNRDKMEMPFRRETRVGCKVMMRVKVLEDKSWEVTGFVEEHTNHVLSSPNKAKMHISHQQFHKSQSCEKLIESLQEEANDPEFYFAIEVDSSGQMRSVFWADGRSRASYLQFSNVVVFDVTYRTNKSSLPFTPFTGVNHHRQSTLLGCALLDDEQEDTFVWLFQEWLKCMHGVEPMNKKIPLCGAIITDQDRAMCNAIHSVFPMTRHRYCFWLMQKHITNHLPTLVSRYGNSFKGIGAYGVIVLQLNSVKDIG
ncbi:protein FAR1-RELATED SEQUENCE 7-like [Asparagus officinalis]|uniref:protein FAR1-RELATED SEQUENCE 7-like n=1 Tax=Asparagus officinalis TaxID=4686 RepID=UPI00098E5D18|nr:protein FAR1-RELATED SEQUENCE 7-like [Asparagus officinalis]